MKKEIAILGAALILLTGCANNKTDDKVNVPAESQAGFRVEDPDPVVTTGEEEVPGQRTTPDEPNNTGAVKNTPVQN